MDEKEQLIDLMSQVNEAVRASEFNTQLATNIFTLCQQLKSHGQKLEQTNKNDLNKVFISLRQAVCRDNGQLGTPCRLKIMELIELRAMSWKTNLAHTQYYLNRLEKSSGSKPQPENNQPMAQFSHSATCPQVSPKQNSPTNNFMSSAPTVQPRNEIPTAFMASAPPPHLQMMPSQFPTPGYFLIPATNGWTPQIMPNILPSPQYAQPPLQIRSTQPPPDWMTQSAIASFPSQFGKIEHPNPMVQSVYTLGLTNKTNKQPQLREEITIKNADSGKIMGVKGRRVAVVEELSQTVISFQKVDANSRYRTLAITGSTHESIQFAKRLIDETIKRNVSPNRLELNEDMTQISSSQLANTSDEKANDREKNSDEDDNPGISIEQGQDGSIKILSDDPDMLEAAQQALTEYLTLRNNRMTAEERELRKERRKSMPLQSTSSATADVTKLDVVAKQSQLEVHTQSNGSFGEVRRQHLGSSPNLLADEIASIKIERSTSELEPPIDVLRYERSKLLEIREAVKEQPLPIIPTVEIEPLNDVEDSEYESEETHQTTN
ncbi:KH domain-containing protein [Aphelenchoides besseyi]|nr:KH domain-containing protein [Aphelenchoides besseyi]